MSEHWQDKIVPASVKAKRKMVEDALRKGTPTPGNARSHTLGYRMDDWAAIEAIKNGRIDPQLVVAKMSCAACAIKIEVLCSRIITDQMIKWLCDDCIEQGFIWAKDVTRQDFYGYQVVKEFKYDTLMRRLDKSPNYKDAYHDPFDPEDRRRIIVPGPSSNSEDPFDTGNEGLRTPAVQDPGSIGGRSDVGGKSSPLAEPDKAGKDGSVS